MGFWTDNRQKVGTKASAAPSYFGAPKTPGSGMSATPQAAKPAPVYPTQTPYDTHVDPYNLPKRVQPKATAPAPYVPGVFENPGYGEDWFIKNKDRLGQTSSGENMMGEASNFFRGPNLAHDFAQDALGPDGYFNKPGYREGYADRQLPGMENTKSYSEQLYESGNQGLNTYYDRERNKRQKRLEDQMAGMGVFGSGATARGMFELEAELGASQARDMADLASQADTSRIARFGESRATAGAGDEGAIDRNVTGVNIGNVGDSSLDRQGRSLLDAGQRIADTGLDRDKFTSDAADRAEGRRTTRERFPIDDAKDLARDRAGINERGTGAISAEQYSIAMDTIQTLLSEGAIDSNEADALQEMLGQGGGNVLRILELLKGGKAGGSSSGGTYFGDKTMPPGSSG